MKKIVTLLVVLIISLQSFAQTTTPMRRPLWVGLDMGGTWQSSDMKAVGGIGWSFTLSRYSRLDKPGILWWGWRFRYMDGNNFGYNYHPLSGFQNDPVLNGSTNPSINYADPNGTNGGKYIFSNYKFHFDEFAFELMLGSQQLRRHGVLLYAFGGAGLDHYKVKTNQLDMLNNMYDYSDVPQTGVDADVKAALATKWDFDYETVKTPGTWAFMPSAGFGMGYQWGNGVALGVEHRTTWALNDNIDGVNYSTEGAGTQNGNDVYNYDGLFVRWTFGGGRSHSTNTRDNPPPPPNPNSYSQNPTNNPTNTTTTTTTNTNNNPSNNPSNYQVYPPTVNFTTPYTNPYSTNVITQQLVVNVTHVQYSSQISLMINNQYSNNFSFNPNTNTMVFTYNLLPGTNYFVVNASNQYGSASDNQTINYTVATSNDPNPTGLPPAVTINNPVADPYNSSTQAYTVTATVLNVATAANIQVLGNSAAINNFTYNAATHQVSFPVSLNTGSNLYEVIGTNSYGSASDAVTINYNPAAIIQPPVVTITSPTACPFTTKTGTATITANITNITAVNQVAITFNNAAVTVFSFIPNASFATVSFVATLNPGTNPFTITGTNTAGTDSKSCSIIYKNQAPAADPPVVTITNPASSPYTSQVQNMTLTASVLNVASQAEITVNYNNVNTSNFQYDMNSHVLTYSAALNVGNNFFTVTAANANGSDSKTATIIYAPAAPEPPTVYITNPASDPYATGVAQQTVIAAVSNITSSSQITVIGTPVQPASFVFNAATQTVTFTVTLDEGANSFTVRGTNAVGTASDAVTIKYLKPVGGIGDNGNSSTPNNTTNNTTANTTTTTSVHNSSTTSSGQNATTATSATSASTSTAVSVNYIDPASLQTTSSISNPSLSFRTSGAASSSEIGVKVNGMHLVNFTFDQRSGIVSFTPTLIEGNNTIEVKVANSTGIAMKQAFITYTAPTSNSNNNRNSGDSGRGSSSTTTTTSGGSTSASTHPKATDNSSSTSQTSGSSSGSTTSSSSGSTSATTTTTSTPKTTTTTDHSSSTSTDTSRGGGSSSSTTTTTTPSRGGSTSTDSGSTVRPR